MEQVIALLPFFIVGIIVLALVIFFIRLAIQCRKLHKQALEELEEAEKEVNSSSDF